MKPKKQMTEKQLANLKPFKKGEVHNPIGQNAHDPVKKAIKKLTQEQLAEVIETILSGTPDDLKKLWQGKDATILQMIVAKAVTKAMERGDWSVPNALLERVLGKVPEKIDHSSSDGSMSPPRTLAELYGRTKTSDA